MAKGIHFEYMFGALIILPIASFYSEHVFTFVAAVLRVAIE
jgi:hypothetical protein